MLERLTLATLGTVVALACWTQPAFSLSEDLVASARKEGKIILYSSSPDTTTQALVKAFNQKYPDIQVSWIRLVSAALFSRFTGEVESGVKNVDLIISPSQQIYQQRPELFQQVSDIEGVSASKIKAKNDHYMVVATTSHLVTYNTDLVTKDDLQKHFRSWSDAGDSFWKGKVALTDPRASTNVMSFFKLMQETYGDDILKKIAAQLPSYFDSGTSASQQVAAGAFSIAYPTSLSHSAQVKAQGAPIDYYMPEGFEHDLETALGIAKEPPHPNAAKLFAIWMISVDGGQKVMCDVGSIPAVPSSNPACKLSPNRHVAVDVIAPDVSTKLLKLLGL